MEKLITVTWDNDYWALYFEQNLEWLTLSELLWWNKLDENNSFIYNISEDDDEVLYITVSDVKVTNEVKKTLSFLVNNNVLDYDSMKHNSYFIIND